MRTGKEDPLSMKRKTERRPLRIGVVGLGNRGLFTVLAHRKDTDSLIVAGADVNKTFFQAYEERLGEEIYKSEDYRDVVNHPDVNTVMVCSPDYLHERHAIDALRNGKDVFIEKPLSVNKESCSRILETAFQYKRKIYVGHNLRFMKFITMMKNLIDDGAIGRIRAVWVRHFVSRGGDCYFKDWHADRSKSNSLLTHKGVHDIDAIHWLCRSYTETTHAFGSLSVYNQISHIDADPVPGKKDESMENWPPLSLKGLNPVIDVEDHSVMSMKLENNILASYSECHYTPDYWRNYTFIGTEGRIENFGSRVPGTKIMVYDKKTTYLPQGQKVITVPNETDDKSSPDTRMMDDFLDYLQLGTSPRGTALDAWRAVAAADAATFSMRNNGAPRNIVPPSDHLRKYFS